MALDGRSGVGKSTLAIDLAARTGGQAIATDDFWAGEQEDLLALAPRERWSRAIDWRRLRIDVREPLRAGRRASWRTFDWETGEGLSIDELTCDPVPVVVIDGAYSSRPELQDVIDVSVLVKLEDHTRRSRLVAREGQEYMAQWHSIWDAAEDYYFSRIRPEESFNLILNTVLVVR